MSAPSSLLVVQSKSRWFSLIALPASLSRLTLGELDAPVVTVRPVGEPRTPRPVESMTERRSRTTRASRPRLPDVCTSATPPTHRTCQQVVNWSSLVEVVVG